MFVGKLADRYKGGVMVRNRFRSAITGILLGGILGAFWYGLIAKFLIAGSFPKDQIILPPEVMNYLYLSTLKFGVLPGACFGLLGGLTTPSALPRGHMAKSIGAFLWIPLTALAWWTQRECLQYMSEGRIAITALMTFFSLLMCLPVSHAYGQLIERIRE
jgi:hypothetical protein